ncbi:Hypothetical protein CINCED_3A014391 [Cinara cedri]|uniref:Uncharacterized protein n=1 Tax=Cinara cedri TaxID=506608 RepID=A0A5E4NCA3_9HEMI|nr:Hypothetical protein CINCED_3A014391 [Cinara cedri]
MNNTQLQSMSDRTGVFASKNPKHCRRISETTGAEFNMTTTNRSDYLWPVPSGNHRIIDWNRFEYKKRQPRIATKDLPPTFRNYDTMSLVPDSEKFPFDFFFLPKGDNSRYPSQDELPQPQLNKIIKPAKNWQRIAVKWDDLQRRIFGGRTID